VSSDDLPPAELTDRLGYLLKHAQLRLAALTGPALAPLGMDGRELAVLLVLADEPLSQQDAARRLGIDRTTMVAMVDALEDKKLLARRADPADRRRNIVEPTAAGKRVIRAANQTVDRVEREFLKPVSARDREHLRDLLKAVVLTDR
jgi:DNA-binding MarR family transcriptional regulator